MGIQGLEIPLGISNGVSPSGALLVIGGLIILRYEAGGRWWCLSDDNDGIADLAKYFSC